MLKIIRSVYITFIFHITRKINFHITLQRREKLLGIKKLFSKTIYVHVCISYMFRSIFYSYFI